MTDPKKHHYVSKMYLKNFATGEGQKAKLVAINIEDRKLFTPGPGSIASEIDFNRIDIDGEDPYAVEKAFGKVEGKIAPALKKVIREGKFPSKEHRNLLLNLMAMFAVRNPRNRLYIEKYRDVLGEIISSALHSPERFESVKNQAIKAGVEGASKIDYEIVEAFQSEMLKTLSNKTDLVKTELAMMRDVLKTLEERPWSFHTALEGNQFVTSDNPVVFRSLDGREQTLKNSSGFDFGGTFVFFPLSPDLALYGPLNVSTLPTELNVHKVASINAMTWNHAHRHVIAKDKECKFVGFDGSYLTLMDLSA